MADLLQPPDPRVLEAAPSEASSITATAKSNQDSKGQNIEIIATSAVEEETIDGKVITTKVEQRATQKNNEIFLETTTTTSVETGDGILRGVDTWITDVCSTLPPVENFDAELAKTVRLGNWESAVEDRGGGGIDRLKARPHLLLNAFIN
jgi:hypothetical protein